MPDPKQIPVSPQPLVEYFTDVVGIFAGTLIGVDKGTATGTGTVAGAIIGAITGVRKDTGGVTNAGECNGSDGALLGDFVGSKSALVGIFESDFVGAMGGDVEGTFAGRFAGIFVGMYAGRGSGIDPEVDELLELEPRVRRLR